MILAFDPGVTTGWACYSSRFDTYKCGELDGDLPELYKFLSTAKPKQLAYEDYKKRAKISTDPLYSVQVIGVIRLWGQQNYVPFYKYLPPQAKGFWSNDKIKKLDLWVPTPGGHAMDAMRVLLTHKSKYNKKWYMETLEKLCETSE